MDIHDRVPKWRFYVTAVDVEGNRIGNRWAIPRGRDLLACNQFMQAWEAAGQGVECDVVIRSMGAVRVFLNREEWDAAVISSYFEGQSLMFGTFLTGRNPIRELSFLDYLRTQAAEWSLKRGVKLDLRAIEAPQRPLLVTHATLAKLPRGECWADVASMMSQVALAFRVYASEVHKKEGGK